MLYNFKRDNYKTLSIFKDNVLPPRSYFIPFSSYDELCKTNIRNERYSSSKVTVLNGEWKFKYFEKRSSMPDEIDSTSFDFDTIYVPSMWQYTGYEKPYYINARYPFEVNPPYFPEDCPVAIYLKDFYIQNKKKTYYLSFLGLAGSLDLFVNGEYIGYSEGSHNTAEFDISNALEAGNNTIAAVVHKWCNGTYLECQDMFRNNGIFRDVLLLEQDDSFIYDIKTNTVYNHNGTYNLDVEVELIGTGNLTVSIDGKSKQTFADTTARICFENLAVTEWNAEKPYLYDLIIQFNNDVVRKRIGFKHIVIKGNTYYFNNQKIKLLGVNHHDTNPKTGYYMTVENMEKDIRIIKEYNMNCVRTSHYPPDPTFLDLCDEYGLYVVDEADIECHGVARTVGLSGACSDNKEWQQHYWDRTYRMYARDKNHPCIVMWSLGNESHGILNHDYCYKRLKELTGIPIHYEGASRVDRWAYDIISQMYPPQDLVKKVAKGKGAEEKFYGKPYFLCEYAHAMGVGAGETDEYVKSFLKADNILGGCVWEFADHAVYHQDGKYKYTYGGDHNEEVHDGNFCIDGLFFPDRKPHAGALQIKNCYRPIRAKLLNGNKIRFQCINYFESEAVTVKWKALSIENEESGEFELTIAPQQSKAISLNIKKPYDAIVLRYYKNGKETASEQLTLDTTLKAFSPTNISPVIKHSENRTIIEFDKGEVIWDSDAGQIVSYKLNDCEFMNQSPLGNIGFNISLFRAPLDNDRNYIEWNKYMLHTECMQLLSSNIVQTENAVVIESNYALSTISVKNLIKAKITYTIFGNGCIQANVLCTDSKRIVHCPRFALTFEMNREFDTVEYFGLGERESLADFKEHAMLGKYKCKVCDLSEKYIKPQESSMRYDTRYFDIVNKNGIGLEFTAQGKTFSFSADHFTSYQCAKAKHQEDLDSFNTTVIHIDSYMLGTGSNSCGPMPSKKYVKNNLKGEKLQFIIKPLG